MYGKSTCSIALWGGDDLGDPSTSVSKDSDGEEKVTNFLSDLEIACREAFGLEEDDGPDSVDDLGNNKLRVETQKIGKTGVTGKFGAPN